MHRVYRNRTYTYRDLTGQTFNGWTITNYSRHRKRPDGSPVILWNCTCVCGAEREVDGNRIFNGYSKSCGCLQKINHRKATVKAFGHAARTMVWLRYKNAAKDRGLVWELDGTTFDRLVLGNCYYCGIAPNQVEHSRSSTGDFLHTGIDRLDSDKGYILDNVVSCCWDCNYAKRDKPLEVFLAWVDRLKNSSYPEYGMSGC